MKYYFYLCFLILILSCSSEDNVSEIIEIDPPETKMFISRIYYESSINGIIDNNVFDYQYDDNNNLTSILRNNDIVTFIYNEDKIVRMENVHNETGEIIDFANYYYLENGLLDYYEASVLSPRIVKYIYQDNQVVEYYSYTTIANLENNNYSFFFKAFYEGNSKNIIEFEKFNSNGEFSQKATRSYNEFEDKRYLGEAAEIINLPYADNLLESFNYYTNNNLKAWQTTPNSNELSLYRESFYEYNEEGYCTQLELVYYNSSTGDITRTITKSFEYIELEVN